MIRMTIEMQCDWCPKAETVVATSPMGQRMIGWLVLDPEDCAGVMSTIPERHMAFCSEDHATKWLADNKTITDDVTLYKK